MTGVARAEQSTAWDLRSAGGTRRRVRLTLTDRCMLPTIVGQVSEVSVTGAFAVVDGWHVPCAEVRGIGRPTVTDQDRYDNAMRRLRAAGELQEAA